MKAIIKGKAMEMTESEAITALNNIRAAFGWSGTEFTRKDIESSLDRKITDEEWKKIQQTNYWSRRMGEAMAETGWDYVDYAIAEAEIES